MFRTTGSVEKRILRTVNEHRHFIVHFVGDLQNFRSRHPSFLLGECIKFFQGVLDIILAQ
jgi:hypothetical protein